ncbi:hypothetical protein GCM10020219_062730 [Nonomuraea dietziae]
MISVEPPGMPVRHGVPSFTCGEEMILLSSTIATLRLGSPTGSQAAAPVSFCQAADSRKSTVTNHETPRCGSVRAAASVTPSPLITAGPRRSG